MPTLNTSVVLLAICASVLAACASKPAEESRVEPAPVRDLFAERGVAAPSPAPAAAPASAVTNATSAATNATSAAAVATPASVPAPVDRPFTLTSEGTTFEVHPPMVDSWDGGIFTGRSVVVAQPPSPAQSVAGTVTLKAVTQVNSAAGVASLVDTEALGVSFPAGVDKTQAWQEFLRFAVPPKMTALPLTQLESGRGVAQVRQTAAAADVTAPRIVVSERPAVLVYIDGNPRYVPVKGTKLMGVLNTRVLLLKDAVGAHYLHLYDGWVKAASLKGPWRVTAAPPGAQPLEQAARASGRVNLLAGKAGPDGKPPALSAARLPDILVVQQPTALIVVDGPPRFTNITGTSLQRAVNTSAQLLKSTATGDVYVQINSAWFRAPAIGGPWSYVPPATLAADFSALPGNGRSRDPGVIVADRRTATLSVNMDGDPVLEPIKGTTLNYVANASVPVIQVDIDNWYAVQNGVWFYATQATGPWTVTNNVPPQIYSIPPTVPIYHAIHSRVMASSTDITYYGYPGAGSHAGEGGAIGVEEAGPDYQYTPPSGMYWGWFY